MTSGEIRLILDLLAQTTVVAPSDAFPYRISRSGFGYSTDPAIAQLQARLSILLQVATEAGR